MKLLVVSLICFLKPLLFLLPLLFATKDILPIIYSINHNQPLNGSDIAKVVKLLLLLFVAYIVSNVLASLPALAGLCLLAAGGCFVVSTNDDLIKILAPHLAPHFSALHALIVSSLMNENSALHSNLQSYPNSSSTHSLSHPTRADGISQDAAKSIFRFAEQLSENLRQATTSWRN